MKIGVTKYLQMLMLSVFFTITTSAQEIQKLSVDECVQIGLKNSNLLHSSPAATYCTVGGCRCSC